MLHARTWPVPAALARHVTEIFRITGDGRVLPRDWLLPEVAGASIAVHLGDVSEIDGEAAPARVVVGALDRARALRHGDRCDVVGIRLAPGCACVLGVTAAAVRAVVAPLATIAPALDAALAAWVEEGADADALPAILVEHARICCDPIAARVARALAVSPAAIGELAVELGLSRRQLARRFTAAVGTSPRVFAQIARFGRAWELAATWPPGRLAELAAAAGYVDQPHLDRDFRTLVGAPPREVFGPAWRAGVVMSPGSKPGCGDGR